MSSVTQRIKEVKQPKGGYINPLMFTTEILDDKQTLCDNENIHPIIMGLVVDYLCRFIMGTDAKYAFKISCKGAIIAAKLTNNKKYMKIAKKLLLDIKGLDNKSIISACKLVTYDVWCRNPIAAFNTKGVNETNPDNETIKNIRIMVERSVQFWKSHGPVIKDGFTFEPEGYTWTVNSGDGDYLTADTLWDFKVSKYNPSNKHTLQLMMYWIMGQHSGQDIFQNISKLGVFNPRLNRVYTIEINKISKEVINEIEKDVICYKI